MNDLLNVASAACASYQFAEAIDVLEQVDETEPDYWSAALLLAVAYEQTGRIADAHRLFWRIAVESPDKDLSQRAHRWLPVVEAYRPRAKAS